MSDRICEFPGCGKPHFSKGFCVGHSKQLKAGRELVPLRPRRSKGMDPIPWFYSSFDTSGGPDSCHEWTRGRHVTGYGCGDTGLAKLYGTRYTHALVWILANGPIPEGLWVCHHCDNPPCGNLSHLFLGTMADDMDDKVAKGRQARGETAGIVKFTEAQVLVIRARLNAGESRGKLAAELGVNLSTIRDIDLRITWKHI